MDVIDELMDVFEAIDHALLKNDVNYALKKTHEGIARLNDERNDE